MRRFAIHARSPLLAFLFAALSLAALLPLTGCVQLNWDRVSFNEPISGDRLLELRPDQSDLGDCLRVLGAPHQVWENNGGVVLAWAWLDRAGWGLSVSYTFTRFVTASVNYADADTDINGVVLVLDSDLRLRQVRRGYFSDITADLRRRPTQVVED